MSELAKEIAEAQKLPNYDKCKHGMPRKFLCADCYKESKKEQK